ncbi:MAG: inositol monophosphatase [Cyanobacteria bacterium NC_groundwater_1444_Ag_S-0.65um_54_12]|nr:inositol monophosphatase [Cyanobacteria bacterium NC_groundwater_1444_Ag_S-0.65um_54_12]
MINYLDAAIAMAQAAGVVHLQYLGKIPHIAYKSDANLVTDADHAAEAIILSQIRRQFPEHAIIAEESGPSGAGEFCWHIDPLDGTTNYAHGLPFFAVSIALAQAGEVILAVVYNAANQELFTATRNGGAYLNGKPIRVSATPDLDRAILGTGFAPSVRRDLHNIPEFVAFIQRCQAIRRIGAASLDLCSVACGRLDGFWEFGLSSWDIAAGALMVLEAGGYVGSTDGTVLLLDGHKIIATNGCLQQAMLEVLANSSKGYTDPLS